MCIICVQCVKAHTSFGHCLWWPQNVLRWEMQIDFLFLCFLLLHLIRRTEGFDRCLIHNTLFQLHTSGILLCLSSLRADLMSWNIMEISLHQVGVALMCILLLFSWHYRNCSRQRMRRRFAFGWKLDGKIFFLKKKRQFNMEILTSLFCTRLSLYMSVKFRDAHLCRCILLQQWPMSQCHPHCPSARPCFSKTDKYYLLTINHKKNEYILI